jgi:hypothetical protein
METVCGVFLGLSDRAHAVNSVLTLAGNSRKVVMGTGLACVYLFLGGWLEEADFNPTTVLLI